jgi:glycosyltransferase involved in cell wall biosynthesis
LKKILHIVSGLGTGGTEMMCLRLAHHWQTSFEQYVIACAPSTRILESEFRSINLGSLYIGPSKSRSYLWQWSWIYRIMRRHRPEAVLIHCFGIPHLIAAAAARIAGIHSIAAWAGNPPPKRKKMRRRFQIIRTASDLLGCPIVACSAGVGREFDALGFKPFNKSRTLPNGINLDLIRREARRANRSRTNAHPVIGMVSRLDPIKDHRTLLEGFALVRLQRPDAKLWIIGDGPSRPVLEALAAELGIATSTNFFGTRTDVASLLGAMDVFAFSTTRDEGFGIALIEAMAAGVPIVASDVPACREVLHGGEAGSLTPTADTYLLAQNITQLLNDNEMRHRLAEKAYRRVQKEYSVEVCAERWEDLLFGSSNSRYLGLPCAS